MSFSSVYLYDDEGQFIGYAILGPNKLQSTNLYREGAETALTEQLQRLNADLDIKAHWPHPQDPEVLAFLNDETFMPIEYIVTDVVDEENSYIVYNKVAGRDDETWDPAWVEGDEIDEEASVIKTKPMRAPKNPSDQVLRIKGACEAVARKRAGHDII